MIGAKGGAKIFSRLLRATGRCENRSVSTTNTYGYSLNWMASRMDGFEYDGTTYDGVVAGGRITVPKPETIIDWMDTNKASKSRRMLSFTALKVWHNCFGEDAESAVYGPPLVSCRRCISADYDKQQRSPEQSANWVDHGCLKKYGAELRKRVFALNKNVRWSKNEVTDAQLAFFITYHLTFPIRRDLHTVEFGIEPAEDEKRNYVDMKTRKVVYNHHKTLRWHGIINHQMNRPMWRLFSLLRKQHKLRKSEVKFVLVNRHWKKFSPSGFSNFLTREFKKMPGCEHKSVGCTGIRHSVITHANRNQRTIAQNREYARKCMHSTKLNAQYRLIEKDEK